jgi:septal ring factor EnvC (AmiA/AmiB activator)
MRAYLLYQNINRQRNMQKLKTMLFVAGTTAFLALGLQSCSNKATEEQMKMLSDLDRQRDGLRSELQRAQDDTRDVKSKLAAQDRDLSDCNSDTQAAKDGLSRWPNVWNDAADWQIAPPMDMTQPH